MSIRVRVVLIAFLLLATTFMPLAISGPSSASPSDCAPRMEMGGETGPKASVLFENL